MRANLELIRQLADTLAPFLDDEATYLDTLDGETDILDLIDAELLGISSDQAHVDALSKLVAQFTARAKRIESRADARRRNLGILMDAAGISKCERPIATVSKRPGQMSVAILDEAEIPSQLMREKVTRSPDKTAIRAQIEAGETVPGATLVRGADTITVRFA